MTSKNNFKTIETERLLLRDFKVSDLDDFVEYRSNPDVSKYQSWENFSEEHGKVFIEKQLNKTFDQLGEYYQIAIELKESQQLIGDCMVHTLAEDPSQIEIGFTLGPGYQGKGFASEAITNLVNYLFFNLHKHRILAITDVKNERSINLLEKIGMRREGHFVQNTWFKGEWGSEYQYAILREEWSK